jgi:dTMP kinase
MAQVDPERYLVIDARSTIEQIHAAIVERVTTLPLLNKNIKS